MEAVEGSPAIATEIFADETTVPGPVTIYAEGFDTESARRDCEYDMKRHAGLKFGDDLDIYEEDTYNYTQKRPFRDHTSNLTYLKNSFSFSRYLRWLHDEVISQHDDGVQVSRMHGDVLSINIEFDGLDCLICGGKLTMSLKWETDIGTLCCDTCSDAAELIVHDRPAPMRCREPKNHDFGRMKEALLGFITDLKRTRTTGAERVVELGEINERWPPETLRTAMLLQELGMAQMFSFVYVDDIYFDEEKHRFYVRDRDSWKERSDGWITLLVSRQIGDQLRWKKEQLMVRLMEYKQTTQFPEKGHNKDVIGIQTVKFQVKLLDDLFASLEDPGATKIVDILKMSMSKRNKEIIPLRWD
jgi:hypothetical protein